MSDETKERLFTAGMREELAHRRVLVFDGPLEDDNGTALMTRLLTMAADDPASPIALWIHSPGGSVPAMLAIRDVMQTIPAPVTTVALGWAASAGQFLLSAGTKGRRYALPQAKVLLHQGSGGIAGTAVDVELQAEDLRHTRDTTLALIAEDTGQPVGKVFQDSLRDHWYTAQQARDYGFIDHIVTSFEEIAPIGMRRTAGLTSQISDPQTPAEQREDQHP